MQNISAGVTADCTVNADRAREIGDVSLFRARLSDSDSCRACQTEAETLPHMLFQCDIISAFWIAFQHWWCERTLRTLKLNECNVI